MSYSAFQEEVRRLVSIRNPITEVTATTSLEKLDSLAIVELCVASEEMLGVPLQFDEVRPLKTYWDLQDVLSGKGYGP